VQHQLKYYQHATAAKLAAAAHHQDDVTRPAAENDQTPDRFPPLTMANAAFRLLRSEESHADAQWRRQLVRIEQHRLLGSGQQHRSRRATACKIEDVREMCPMPGCHWTLDTDIPDNEMPILKCNDGCQTAGVRNVICNYPTSCPKPEIELTYTGRRDTYDAQEECFKLASGAVTEAKILTVQRTDVMAAMESRVDALVAARSDWEVLFIYDLGLMRVPAATLQRMSTTLTFLDLSTNKITHINGSDFAALSELNTVYLSRNGLQELGAKTFAHNAKLKTVFLNHNKIRSIPANVFGGHTAIKQLNLASNQLATLPDDLLSPGSNIDTLSVAYNKLTSIPGAVLSLGADLEFLSVANNPLTIFPQQFLRLNFTVSFLDLENIHLSALSSHWAQELQNITVAINIAGNKLTQLNFTDHGRMRILNAASTRLSKLSLPVPMDSVDVSDNILLRSLSLTGTLETLDISGTSIPMGGGDIECTRHGLRQLYVRDMRDPSWYAPEVLTKCIGKANRREVLDISRMDGLSEIRAVRQALHGNSYYMNMPVKATSDGYLYFFNTSYTWYDPAPALTHLLMIGSPTQCKYEQTRSALVYERSALYYSPLSQVAVAEHACQCTAGYSESKGVCYANLPWIAQPGIQALVSLLTLGAVAVIVFVLLRRFRKQRKTLQEKNRVTEDKYRVQKEEARVQKNKARRMEKTWRVKDSEVDAPEVTPLGKGQFGVVRRGRWRGFDVAVKILQATMLDIADEESSIEVQDFWKEADFLAFARHANLVAFYGAGEWQKDGPRRPFLLLELVELGSLSDILRADEEKGKRLDYGKAMQVARDVSSAMCFIHDTLQAAHRDLKTANILITADWRGKVTDFGSITVTQILNGNETVESTRQTRTSSNASSMAWTVVETSPGEIAREAQGITVEYSAPEVLLAKDEKLLDLKMADVWSFGVVLWEMVETRLPDLVKIHGCQSSGPYSSRQAALLNSGRRHNFGVAAPQWAKNIYVQCTKMRPDERPTFQELHKWLGNLLANEPPGEAGAETLA
jgi:hypothetical protein